MSNRVYTPDCWVVLEFTDLKGEVTKKVFAGWYGGFTQGDSWQLSSGIVNVVDKGEYYEVKNHSGSTYLLHKLSNKLSSYTTQILKDFEQGLEGSGMSVRQVDMVTSE